MKKKNLGVLYFLIASIVVLFTAMLVLCGMYLDLRLNGITSSLPEIPENDKWILTDSSYNAHNSSGQMITPVFMGVKTEMSGMTAAVYNSDAREGLDKYIEPKMMALFGGNVQRIEFKNEDEKNSFISETINSDVYIFMSFYNELPASALLAGIYGSGSYIGFSESFDVKYIFIMPDGESIKGVCFDNELEACVLRPNETVPFDQSVFYAYNEVSGFADFSFWSDTCPEPVFTKSFEMDSVIMVSSFSFYSFNLGDRNTTKLLTALDFNPNLVKTYTYSDNNIISFVGEEKELHVSRKEGKLVYNGYDGGIHMSEYLKYYPQSDEYTFTDSILCVKYLINSLDRILVGGDALPSIVGIGRDGGKTVFKLKYFFHGAAVTENSSDITITIDGEYINCVEINTLFCDSGSLSMPVVPQRLALEVFDDEIYDESFAGFSTVFKEKGISGNAELIWTVRKEE